MVNGCFAQAWCFWLLLGLGDFVLLYLFSQGIAVDAQNFRRAGLVELGLMEDKFDHRALDLADDHLIDITRHFVL